MPDSSGKLTQEERVAVSAFINEKAKSDGDPCAVCGHTDTRVGHALLGVPTSGADGIGAEFMPCVPVICHNCGNVRLFHSEALGLTARTLSEPGV